MSGALKQMPVAVEWFRRRDVAPGVELIEEPYVSNGLRGNYFLVTDRGEALLIDAGMGLAPLRSWLGPAAPTRVVITHAHYDHQGGAHEFPKVMAHPAEWPGLRSPSGLKLRGSDFSPDVRRLIRGAGFDLADSLLLSALPSPDFDPERFAQLGVSEPTSLVEGDFVSVGTRRFTVVHLPGHSPGSIGLLEERTGLLFSGDAIYKGPILDTIPGADPDEYRSTMKRLSELECELVLGGHGAPLSGAAMREKARSYLER